jgi:hypothetical protein
VFVSARYVCALASSLGLACSSDVIVGGYDSARPARVGGAGDSMAWSLDVDPDDNVYLAGAFDGELTIGGQTRSAHAGAEQSGFAAGLDPRGALRWIATEPASLFASLEYVHVVGERVFATGIYLGTLDKPTGVLDSSSGQDLLLSIYDRAGSAVDARSFGNDRNVQGKAVASDPSGTRIALGGHYVGDVDFGGGVLPTTAGDFDYGFVAAFDPSMRAEWSRAITGSAQVFVDAVAIDASGNLYACGWFEATVDLDGGMASRGGPRDGFLAAFGPGGTELWARRIGGPGDDAAYFMDRMPDGDLVVTGRADDAVDLGGGALAGGAAGETFVARFGSDGTFRGGRLLGGAGRDGGEAVEALDDGSILLGLSFSDRLSFGGRELVSEGATDIAIAELDGALEPRWVRTFGGAGAEHVGAIGFQSSGHVVFAASFEGTLALEGAPLTSAGGVDVLVHRFVRGP